MTDDIKDKIIEQWRKHPGIAITQELTGNQDEWTVWPADELAELAIKRGYLSKTHKEYLINELYVWMHITFNSYKESYQYAMTLQSERYKEVEGILEPKIKSLPESK